MGQDDRCGLCGKNSCSHMNRKEHLGYDGGAVCGRKNVITNDFDVDAEITCKDCQRIIHGPRRKPKLILMDKI